MFLGLKICAGYLPATVGAMLGHQLQEMRVLVNSPGLSKRLMLAHDKIFARRWDST